MYHLSAAKIKKIRTLCKPYRYISNKDCHQPAESPQILDITSLKIIIRRYLQTNMKDIPEVKQYSEPLRRNAYHHHLGTMTNTDEIGDSITMACLSSPVRFILAVG